jgi:hypothetical protein
MRNKPGTPALARHIPQAQGHIGMYSLFYIIGVVVVALLVINLIA